MSKQTELAQVADTITVNSGNVGIGTSSPSAVLEVNTGAASDPIIQVTNSNAAAYRPSLGIDNQHTGGRNYRIFSTATGDGVFSGGKFVIYDNDASAGRLTIDSSGNLLVGATSPILSAANRGNITLNGTSESIINLGVGGAQGGYLYQTATELALWNTKNGPLRFSTNNAERMRLDASGNLLVGTTSILDAGSENAIHIQGSTSAAKWCMVTQSHSRGRVHVHTSSGGISDYFITGSTNVGAISQSTTSTSYATSSDYRLKTDAQPMTGASARVQALNPVNFEWIADGTRVDGFLAHEAQAVVPEAVTGAKDAMRDEEYEVTPAVLDDDGNVTTEAVMGTRSVPDYQGIDQSKLVPLLTAALQEALTKIDDLETRLTALEAV